MIRNLFMYIILLAFCLFIHSTVTKGSPSQGGLSVDIYQDNWSVLFNLSQEFYDKHRLFVEVMADDVYDGWFSGDGYVTGKLSIVNLDERAEGFLGNPGEDTFYLGGCYAGLIPVPSIIFWDNPNVNVPGDGWGWGRIYGIKANGSSDMAEDSQYFHFNGSSSDITPKCDHCTDANPNCPKADDRHFHH